MKNRNVNYPKTILFCFAVFALSFIYSCKQEVKPVNTTSVVIDTKFTALFAPDSGGITGADGVFSVPLSNGQSAFLMGDCFLGNVTENKRDINTTMMNNSFVLINKAQDEAKAIYKGTYEEPVSIIEPNQNDEIKRWYWPGHGFTEDSILYIFALNMYNDPNLIVKSTKPRSEMDKIDEMTESMFAFQVAGVDILSFKLPEFKQLSVNRVEYAYKTDIHFGNSVFIEGEYIYFLGTKNYPDKSKPHIARTKFGKIPYHENWEFHNGVEWVSNYTQSIPIDIDISVSEQFSLFKLKDKYVLLIQEKGKGDIYTYTSDIPYGNFKNKSFIFHTPERENGVEGMTTYNAMAHPQYIDEGMLLVSYCTNAAVREIFNDVNNYRPRFIRVPIALIDSTFSDIQ